MRAPLLERLPQLQRLRAQALRQGPPRGFDGDGRMQDGLMRLQQLQQLRQRAQQFRGGQQFRGPQPRERQPMRAPSKGRGARDA